MNKRLLTFLLGMLVCLFTQGQQREIILNCTGYGFDPGPPPDAISNISKDMYNYLQAFANMPEGSRPTAVRFYVTWQNYEPTFGQYKRTELIEAIAAVKAMANWKIALHFPYSRSENSSSVPIDEVAETDPSQVGKLYGYPSIFSQTMRTKFYDFVGDVLNTLINAGHGNILYVEMGAGKAEEYAMPYFREEINGQLTGVIYTSGHEQRALDAWRNEYLPCRYPGQSTVTWDGNTYNINQAPGKDANQNWNNDKGKEFHRFISWGLLDHYKKFRDRVKSYEGNGLQFKVLYFIPDFGGAQGNTQFMHSASLPMALQEFDGIYHSDGNNNNDLYRKIYPIDVIKGTNSSKIAALEFDSEDLGSHSTGFDGSLFQQWGERAFKHGAEYIHLAMYFHENERNAMVGPLAYLKSNYINSSANPPSPRTTAPVVSQIVPNVFTTTEVFKPEWDAAQAYHWGNTDGSPVSIQMKDDGYWQNVWSCSPPSTCDYNLSLSGPSGSVQPSSTINLTSSCSGSSCSGLTYSWSGNGISGSGSSISFQAPSTAGTYSYTLTATKSGCSKTASVTVTVANSGGGGGEVCQNLGDQCSGNSAEIRSYSITLSGGSQPVKLTYKAHEKPSIIKMRINGGSWQDFNVAQVTDFTQTTLGNFNVNNGSNTFEFASGDGFVCFRELCVGTTACTPPAAPTLTASPSTITSGSSSTLSASGCSGTLNWSHSLSGSSPEVSPTTTTTYTATCTVNGCTSAEGSVTVTVSSNPPQGNDVCTNMGDQCSGNSSEIRTATNTLTSAGTYPVKITYRAHEKPSILKMRINNGTWQDFNVAQTGSNEYVQVTLGNFALNTSNTFDFASGDGFQCYRELCVTVATTPSVNCNTLEGFFDEATCNTIAGWAYDWSNPNTSITVDLYDGANLVQANIPAANYRQDLQNAGKGNGMHGFSISTPASLKDGQSHNLSVKVSGCSYTLNNSPKTISGCSGSSVVLDPVNPDESAGLRQLQVRPNPSTGQFITRFYLEKGKQGTISVIDMFGRVIYRKVLVGQGQHQERINLHNKANGTLLLQLQTNKGSKTQKIQIIR